VSERGGVMVEDLLTLPARGPPNPLHSIPVGEAGVLRRHRSGRLVLVMAGMELELAPASPQAVAQDLALIDHDKIVFLDLPIRRKGILIPCLPAHV